MEFKKEVKITKKSVRMHLISDAPICVFLSGGLDSTIISLLSSMFKEDIITLSITFDEKEYDESYYQGIVKRKIKSRHISYKVRKEDFKNEIININKAMDQPTFDGVNTYFVTKFAKEAGIKSVLSGLGGDELFGGYPSFFRIERLFLLKLLLRNFRFFEYSSSDRYKRLSYLGLKNSISYYLSLRGLFTVKEISKLLDIDEKDVYKAIEMIYWDKCIKDIGKKNFASFFEMFYMRNQLLKDTDFMSMWNSVEIRVPFLDLDLLNCVLMIDENIKFKSNKYLLKESFKDILPYEILHRKKKSFNFPMMEWVKDLDEYIIEGSILNKKSLYKYIKKIKKGKLR